MGIVGSFSEVRLFFLYYIKLAVCWVKHLESISNFVRLINHQFFQLYSLYKEWQFRFRSLGDNQESVKAAIDSDRIGPDFLILLFQKVIASDLKLRLDPSVTLNFLALLYHFLETFWCIFYRINRFFYAGKHIWLFLDDWSHRLLLKLAFNAIDFSKNDLLCSVSPVLQDFHIFICFLFYGHFQHTDK